MGRISVPANNYVIHSRNIFLKDASPLDIAPPAMGFLMHDTEAVIAGATHGKGRIIAIGDPWLYNEYIDHRRLPGSFDNLGAANNLVDFLLKKTEKK